jgi:hypothetical protein
MCTAVAWWMDGWMDERHPADKCNATTTISDHIRWVVQIQTQAEEPLQPQVTLRWRLPPLVFTAATLPSPTPHLRSSRPPARPRSLLAVLSASLFLPAFISLWDCYKLVTHRSGGNNPEPQSRTSDGDRGQAIRVLAELRRELISQVSKRRWRTTRSWRKLVKEPMARYIYIFSRSETWLQSVRARAVSVVRVRVVFCSSIITASSGSSERWSGGCWLRVGGGSCIWPVCGLVSYLVFVEIGRNRDVCE